MKKFILISVTIFSLASCKKEYTLNNSEIIGEWHWKKSYGEAQGSTFTVVPNGTVSTLVLFTSDRIFENKSACLLPGPSKASFELKSISDFGGLSQILILSSANKRDTFNIKLSDNQLILRERRVNNSEVIFHAFEK